MKKEFKQAVSNSNTSKMTVFLDLDGVIADFDTHLHSQNKLDERGNPKWDELDHEWFSTIPVYDGAQDFYFRLKEMAPVKFLTAPTMSTGSIAGKADWVQNSFLPRKGQRVLMDFIIAPSKDKQYLAGPDRILVDDREKNIREWEQAGGKGVLHTGDFEKTLKAVRDIIEGWDGATPPEASPEQPRL